MVIRIVPLFLLTLVMAQLNTSSAAERQARKGGDKLDKQSLRDWTDSTGRHRARATLVQVENERILLRTENGRLAEAALSELSEPDRQFVASQRRTPAPAKAAQSDSLPSPPSVVSKVLENVAGNLPSIQDAVSAISPAIGRKQSEVNPAGLLYVRVSRDFVDRHMQRTIDKLSPVRDLVLGTDIHGESNTTGETHVNLLPGDGIVRAEIVFDGTVHSRTTGYNGPAILHYVSETPFQARKTISLTDTGLNVSDAKVSSSTRLQTTGVETTLPRLRGRIASRIAARRNANSHAEAEAITGQHTADRVRADFDRGASEKIAKLQSVFDSALSRLAGDRDQPNPIIRFRSTNECAEMAMIRADAHDTDWELKPPGINGNPDVAVRINRSLVGRILADPEWNRQLAPLIARFSLGPSNTSGTVRLAADNILAGSTPKISIDGNWVVIDIAPPQSDARRNNSPSH